MLDLLCSRSPVVELLVLLGSGWRCKSHKKSSAPHLMIWAVADLHSGSGVYNLA